MSFVLNIVMSLVFAGSLTCFGLCITHRKAEVFRLVIAGSIGMFLVFMYLIYSISVLYAVLHIG